MLTQSLIWTQFPSTFIYSLKYYSFLHPFPHLFDLNNMNPTPKLKWKSDFDKYVILVNFEKRQWQHCSGNDDWNIFWASVWVVKKFLT